MNLNYRGNDEISSLLTTLDGNYLFTNKSRSVFNDFLKFFEHFQVAFSSPRHSYSMPACRLATRKTGN